MVNYQQTDIIFATGAVSKQKIIIETVFAELLRVLIDRVSDQIDDFIIFNKSVLKKTTAETNQALPGRQLQFDFPWYKSTAAAQWQRRNSQR
ncbi:MAG: hypothetical protein ACD_39C01828G0001 [uncultured bacterium]|nr:MAG: hypothetical protein ACD_39C01828G0001 [uncultured bacterium]